MLVYLGMLSIPLCNEVFLAADGNHLGLNGGSAPVCSCHFYCENDEKPMDKASISLVPTSDF